MKSKVGLALPLVAVGLLGSAETTANIQTYSTESIALKATCPVGMILQRLGMIVTSPVNEVNFTCNNDTNYARPTINKESDKPLPPTDPQHVSSFALTIPVNHDRSLAASLLSDSEESVDFSIVPCPPENKPLLTANPGIKMADIMTVVFDSSISVRQATMVPTEPV